MFLLCNGFLIRPSAAPRYPSLTVACDGESGSPLNHDQGCPALMRIEAAVGRPMKEPLERRSAAAANPCDGGGACPCPPSGGKAGLSVTELVRQRTFAGKLTPRRGLADAQLPSRS